MAADMKDAQSLLRFWALKAEKQAANPDMDPGRRIHRQSSDVAADQPESMAQVRWGIPTALGWTVHP